MTNCPFCEKAVPAGSPNCPHCGAAVSNEIGTASEQPQDVRDSELRALVNQGRKIDAIKIYREQTGAGLAEAKAAVEAIASDIDVREELSQHGTPDEALAREAELLRMLQAGEKIQAIKRYREWTGAGLKEAKDAVEGLAARHGIVAQSRGCLTMLLVCLTAAAMVLLLEFRL